MSYDMLKADKIIEKIEKTNVGNEKKLTELVKAFLTNKYSLYNFFENKAVYNTFCFIIRSQHLYVLLKNYSLLELSVFEKKDDYDILIEISKRISSIDSYELICKFNTTNFSSTNELRNLTAYNLYNLIVKYPDTPVFFNALFERKINELREIYVKVDNIIPKIRKLIIQKMYRSDNINKNGDNFSILKPEDIGVYFNLIDENKNVELACNLFITLNKNQRVELLNIIEKYDDGKEAFFLLSLNDITPTLTKEEKEILESVMARSTNAEYKFYWMYNNDRNDELRSIFKNSSSMINFLSNFNHNNTNAVIEKLREEEEKEIQKYSEELENYGSSYVHKHNQVKEGE